MLADSVEPQRHKPLLVFQSEPRSGSTSPLQSISTLRESTSSPMLPSRRRRGSSPDPPSKRRRTGSSPDPSSKRPRTGSRSRSRSDSRHRRRSPSRSPPSSHPPRRAPVFPSHHDHPDLPENLRVLCEILSSPSHSLLSLLDNTGIRVTKSDVETVLRLSYSHPGPAITFFRWAGERHLDHMHSPYAWNLVVDMLGKNLHFDTMWDTVCSMRDLNLLSLATFASIFASLAADGRAEEALAAFRVLPLYGIPRDTVALNSLLAAMCRAGLLRDARAVLHESVMAGVRLDADSFAVLLEGFENEKDAKFAQKVFMTWSTTIG
ncbi:pentatricopeptide repeat-containing protein [Carex littledalei]|uniref:Pentatricopeptide repeat-containing protein n=1 Tax=Carex littledalei TaxID=544730 RepID=A0A833R6V5_9POAL|nr:pentatricopeptide repeat-containing protein [Carex littledalei]